jgi:hypothetical protein
MLYDSPILFQAGDHPKDDSVEYIKDHVLQPLEPRFLKEQNRHSLICQIKKHFSSGPRPQART